MRPLRLKRRPFLPLGNRNITLKAMREAKVHWQEPSSMNCREEAIADRERPHAMSF